MGIAGLKIPELVIVLAIVAGSLILLALALSLSLCAVVWWRLLRR